MRTIDAVNNLKKEQERLRRTLETLPKGSIRCKLVRNRQYYYLQFREGNKVRSVYIRANEIDDIREKINMRIGIEKRLKDINHVIKENTALFGEHKDYRPVKNVDYEAYTLFMSTVAHDYKRLGIENFLLMYDVSKHRGIKKRYLKGIIEYIAGIERTNTRKGTDLVLDPYTYLMHFKYGDQTALQCSLEKAIPAFLNQGLLITDVQEAVTFNAGNGQMHGKHGRKN